MSTFYWVGGSGSYDLFDPDATHWSLTSGGAGGEGPPGSDTAIFDAHSGGGTISIGFIEASVIDATGFTGAFVAGDFGFLSAQTITLGSGMTFDPAISITVLPSDIDGFIASAGHHLGAVDIGTTTAHKATLIGDLYCADLLTQGVFDASGYNVNAYSVTGLTNAFAPELGFDTAEIKMGSGDWVVRGDGSCWEIEDGSGITTGDVTTTLPAILTKGTGSLTFSGDSFVFYTGGADYGDVALQGTGDITVDAGLGGVASYDSMTITNPPRLVSWKGKHTVNGATAFNGVKGHLMTLGPSPRSPHWELVSAADIAASYVKLRGSQASGGGKFTALGSVDLGGNYGWIFIKGTNPRRVMLVDWDDRIAVVEEQSRIVFEPPASDSEEAPT